MSAKKAAEDVATGPAVELTSEEQAQVLAEAVARKAAQLAEEQAAAQAEADDAGKRDPAKYIVVNGSVQEPPAGYGVVYRLPINGRNYEHVGDDQYGRWIYRAM